MKIETVTFVYNEEFLLPFYLKHYDFVDRINILYDMASTDRTLEILKSNAKVNIIPVNYPGGWNSLIKQLMLHDFYSILEKDMWVLNVDCDEFAFIENLPSEDNSIYRIAFYNVFRNIVEDDLDINKTIKEQRSYGELKQDYIKPILTNSNFDVRWTPGCHIVAAPIITEEIPMFCNGAHWENADSCFCIERRCKNRLARQSRYNVGIGYGIQNHFIDEQKIIDLCKEHSNDKKLW